MDGGSVYLISIPDCRVNLSCFTLPASPPSARHPWFGIGWLLADVSLVYRGAQLFTDMSWSLVSSTALVCPITLPSPTICIRVAIHHSFLGMLRRLAIPYGQMFSMLSTLRQLHLQHPSLKYMCDSKRFQFTSCDQMAISDLSPLSHCLPANVVPLCVSRHSLSHSQLFAF